MTTTSSTSTAQTQKHHHRDHLINERQKDQVVMVVWHRILEAPPHPAVDHTPSNVRDPTGPAYLSAHLLDIKSHDMAVQFKSIETYHIS